APQCSRGRSVGVARRARSRGGRRQGGRGGSDHCLRRASQSRCTEDLCDDLAHRNEGVGSGRREL
ncbi:hypothetical protein ACHAWF_000471, partial [Thalassiosira exigua]